MFLCLLFKLRVAVVDNLWIPMTRRHTIKAEHMPSFSATLRSHCNSGLTYARISVQKSGGMGEWGRVLPVEKSSHWLYSRVCVEPPPSALNKTLPAFAAERRRLWHSARGCRSISPVRRALSSKPTGRCCCCWSVGQIDGRTDAKPLHRPFSACLRAAPIAHEVFFYWH